AGVAANRATRAGVAAIAAVRAFGATGKLTRAVAAFRARLASTGVAIRSRRAAACLGAAVDDVAVIAGLAAVGLVRPNGRVAALPANALVFGAADLVV